MADKNVGKIIQVISAVLDIKFSEGNLPEINDAVEVPLKTAESWSLRLHSIWATIQSDVSPWDLLMVSSAAWTLSQQEHLFLCRWGEYTWKNVQCARRAYR